MRDRNDKNVCARCRRPTKEPMISCKDCEIDDATKRVRDLSPKEATLFRASFSTPKHGARTVYIRAGSLADAGLIAQHIVGILGAKAKVEYRVTPISYGDAAMHQEQDGAVPLEEVLLWALGKEHGKASG